MLQLQPWDATFGSCVFERENNEVRFDVTKGKDAASGLFVYNTEHSILH